MNPSKHDATAFQGQTTVTRRAELPCGMTSEVLFTNLSLSSKKKKKATFLEILQK